MLYRTDNTCDSINNFKFLILVIGESKGRIDFKNITGHTLRAMGFDLILILSKLVQILFGDVYIG